MGVGSFLHHIGTFLLLVATVLLVITTISSPIVDHIAIMNVKLANGTNTHDTHVTLGTFGYCLLDAA
jgi:hypothetical protein